MNNILHCKNAIFFTEIQIVSGLYLNNCYKYRNSTMNYWNIFESNIIPQAVYIIVLCVFVYCPVTIQSIASASPSAISNRWKDKIAFVRCNASLLTLAWAPTLCQLTVWP